MELKTLMNEVKKNDNFVVLQNGKIHCKLTKHDILPKLDEFRKYLSGKSYKMALEKVFDISHLKPYIEPYKKDPEQYLWCNVTKTRLAKLKSVVEKHVKGKKYNRDMPDYMKKREAKEAKKILIEKSKAEKKIRIAARRAARALAEQEGTKVEEDFNVEDMDALVDQLSEEEDEDYQDEGMDEEDDDDDMEDLVPEDEEENGAAEEEGWESVDSADEKVNGNGKSHAKADVKKGKKSKKIQKVEKKPHAAVNKKQNHKEKIRNKKSH
jgi:hypothetical protein